MKKKLGKIVGIKMEEFLSAIKDENGKELTVRPARLIPFIKPGHETALTSIFLSAIRLVKEFREDIFSEIGLSKAGEVHVFTEIAFNESDSDIIDRHNQPDGLILVVVGGKIKDAALFEMKNGYDKLDENQVKSYIKIAQRYNINKLITVSNQFVTTPTQSPLNISVKKVNSAQEMYNTAIKFFPKINIAIFSARSSSTFAITSDFPSMLTFSPYPTKWLKHFDLIFL